MTSILLVDDDPDMAELLGHMVDILGHRHRFVRTGPEALAGSTRLKAGTAQKMMLNSFSTALMIRLGKTWSNLMVSVLATNEKLRARTVRILMEATGQGEEPCRAALAAADGDLKVALVSMLTGSGPARSKDAVDAAGGVRAAVESLAV